MTYQLASHLLGRAMGLIDRLEMPWSHMERPGTSWSILGPPGTPGPLWWSVLEHIGPCICSIHHMYIKHVCENIKHIQCVGWKRQKVVTARGHEVSWYGRGLRRGGLSKLIERKKRVAKRHQPEIVRKGREGEQRVKVTSKAAPLRNSIRKSGATLSKNKTRMK